LVNNALGRPLLPDGAARDVGCAANNALKKEKRETAEAKARTSAAISAARAAAREDPRLLPAVVDAEAAREAELATILLQEYNLQLPAATVGAKRKRAGQTRDPFQALQYAEAAYRQAEQELEKAKHYVKQLGPPRLEYPADLDDIDGEEAASRRYWREYEVHQRAAQAEHAAYVLLDRRMDQRHQARLAAWDEQDRLDAARREAYVHDGVEEGSREMIEILVHQAEAKKHLLGPVGSRHDFARWLPSDHDLQVSND
jgi:hypothetical protein